MLYAFEAEVVHIITESVKHNRSLRGERATFQSSAYLFAESLS